MSVGRWLAIGASVAIAATVVAAIVAMGSPASQRERNLDRRRIQDLRQLETLIEQHHREKEALPKDLAALAAHPGWRVPVADPVTAAPYGYALRGERSYRLCAVFLTDTARNADAGEPVWMDAEWSHPAGPHCFERKLPPPSETK